MPENNRIGGYRAGKIPDDAIHKRIGGLESLPLKVDLRPFMTEVEEQVGMSCVANAFAGAYEYLAKRTLGKAHDVSRLFIYYNARAAEGDEDKDNGSQMSNAIKGLKEYGACGEEHWPNEQDMITEAPDDPCYDHAANFKIVEAEYLKTDLNLWKHTLAEGHPIAFCLNTFTSFDDANSNRGRVPMPKSTDNVRATHGWHAMLCVGYSDPDKMFIVRNSWGTTWGDKGYCYIPYDYVIHKDYNGHDSWIIKSAENLDFDDDTWDDSDDSNFAQDGMTYLTDFYIQVEDADEFATALEDLCKEYVDDEENYYFDYETATEKKIEYTYITGFEILTNDPDGFMEDLEALCDEWAIDGDYDYTLADESEDNEDSEEDDEEEDDEEEDDDSEEEEETPKKKK